MKSDALQRMLLEKYTLCLCLDVCEECRVSLYVCLKCVSAQTLCVGVPIFENVYLCYSKCVWFGMSMYLCLYARSVYLSVCVCISMLVRVFVYLIASVRLCACVYVCV